MRPDVHPARASDPECSARSTRCPAPSWNTLLVLFVMVSISPVPNELPGPVSYFHVPVLTPVPAPPLNSSLQVSVKPAGGAATAATAAAACGVAAVVPADSPAYATAVTASRAAVVAAVKAAARTRRRLGRGVGLSMVLPRGWVHPDQGHGNAPGGRRAERTGARAPRPGTGPVCRRRGHRGVRAAYEHH